MLRAAPKVLLLALLTLLAGEVASGESVDPREWRFGPENARVEFEIAALWLLRRHGHFAHIEGWLQRAPDGRSGLIRVRIRSDSVRMQNSDHVRLLLSSEFFAAAEHPWIEFESAPFTLGGAGESDLPGWLSLRGVRRKVRFRMLREACAEDPSRLCAIRVDGSLRRSRYGMDSHRRTLSDRVHLHIEVLPPVA